MHLLLVNKQKNTPQYIHYKIIIFLVVTSILSMEKNTPLY